MAYVASKKRLLKNTIYLFLRQIFCVFVGFFSTRVVLKQLGVEDFGIYNVVYGVVAMFEIVTGAIPVSISRFITYELGKNNVAKIQKLFSTALFMQALLGTALCIFAFAGGYWFICNKMVIDFHRVDAAVYILLCACISFALRMLYVPFDAIIIAYEKMSFYAFKGVFEALCKLLVAICLLFVSFDKLPFFATLNTLVILAVLALCSVYVKVKFSQYKQRFAIDFGILKHMGIFTGWAFLGNGATIVRDQGLNIMLNLFFGNAINAARGISVQISSTLANFVNTFLVSAQPQITKLYADKNLPAMQKTVFLSSKISFFLMAILAFPIIARTDYFLYLWLGEYPAYTNSFVVLLTISIIIDTVSWPFAIGLFAEGNIKVYEIVLFIINTLNVPASYIFLKYGFSPDYVYFVLVAMMSLVAISRIVMAKKAYSISIYAYITEVALRIFAVCAFTIICSKILTNFVCIDFAFAKFLFDILIAEIFVLFAIFAFGLTKPEKTALLQQIKQKLHCGKL